MSHFFSSFSFIQKLLIFLILKAMVLILFIQYAGIELGPDEAQYWTWSQALDWGYYSKPPGIAWQIAAGTFFWGQTELGVRFLSLIISFFQAYLIYLLALEAKLSSKIAFWSALGMALSPLGILGSFFAITDVGFLLCWTAACLITVKALNRMEAPNPLKVGLWILIGALFKWPIYLFWVFFIFCRHWYFPRQPKIEILKGVALSVVGLAPSIYWNMSHDWATFRHVSATLQGGSGAQASGNVAAFIGSQALLLSPILFILFIMGMRQWIKQRKILSPALFFCGFITFVSLSLMILAACFQKIQGNWITLAYPTAFIVLGWYALQQYPKKAKWFKAGIALSVFLMLSLFMIPSFYTNPALMTYAPSYRLNPFKHNLGYAALSEALNRQGYQAGKHFLVSDKYQTTSLLSFYNQGQKRAYFLNLIGIRNNQFSYWPSLHEEQKRKTGYFIWTENMPYLKNNGTIKRQFYQNELEKYFEKVEFLELVPLVYQNLTIAKAALLFRCQNSKNLQLMNSRLY